MPKGGQGGPQSLEYELKHYLELLADERTALNELQRRVGCTVTESNDEDDSTRREQLLANNRALRYAIGRLRHDMYRFQNLSQVNDIRNKITVVWKELREVQAEVKTLLSVRRQQNKSLEKLSKGDRLVSVLRGKQHEEQHDLRAKLKELESELKAIEKRDAALRERFIQLQKQTLLRVTEKDVAALRAKHEEQMRLIQDLQRQRGKLVMERDEAAADSRRQMLKAEREKAEMERDIAELRALVLARDEELTQLHLSLGK
ncbi:hypothetical protein TraAM80_07781 [Trypanosoma rangeli]|uniref:Uncharacterized protein n=1 Tax=Trypanosoma rangeli TaxID=5698 RepID=A0A422N3X5_TRYRA|nr:uncharacterized protein TraAM80_07781 [Trypanosoma rangeli]RNF00140.1 hypothetical protein TraAM80_07781 [Trypanosoma rangeli]|eukprot:RNF00140.1 hypothetical protein TraAM80_07781 [Trypanosoma rangeli]